VDTPEAAAVGAFGDQDFISFADLQQAGETPM
jgi:hypothetical protein